MNHECIFCKIIAKEIPSHIIYEDSIVLAILDIHPINAGHILVIPKQHVPDFYNLDDSTYTHCQLISKKVAQKIQAEIHPKRVGLAIIGWDVAHTHIHIVPMYEHEDITSGKILQNGLLQPTPEELQGVKEQLYLEL